MAVGKGGLSGEPVQGFLDQNCAAEEGGRIDHRYLQTPDQPLFRPGKAGGQGRDRVPGEDPGVETKDSRVRRHRNKAINGEKDDGQVEELVDEKQEKLGAGFSPAAGDISRGQAGGGRR